MASLKRKMMPVIILVGGIAVMIGLSSMKKPPAEKEKVDNTPIVAVETISLSPISLQVKSYGEVKPKYETELVAQVSGQVVELADAFVRGGFVNKGQLLARIDPSDYQAALLDAQANLAAAKAAFKTELAQGKVAEKEWKRITDTAPTELSLRKPQLAKELARVKAAQAAMLRAKRNLERTEIKAPYDAMIENRKIGLGSFVTMGAPIGKLLGTEMAEVRLPVADNQLQYLKNQGEQAQVLLTGKFAGHEVTWQAMVARDEGVIDNTSRMNYLVAQIADPYALHHQQNKPLRFGSYVTAAIQGIELANATYIPRHLVNEGKVALLDTDSKLHFSEVNIVREEGNQVIVSKGVADGDKLIVSALDYPVDGMKLALLSEQPEKTPNVDEKTEQATQVASVED